MGIEGIGSYYNFHRPDRRCDDGRADCGPRPSFAVHGNTVETRYYNILFGNHEVTAIDKETGQSFRVWGDPHINTSDGDSTDFQKRSITFNLPKEALKLTAKPTEVRNGVSNLDEVVLTDLRRGGDAVVAKYDAAGKPTIHVLPDQGRRLDRLTPDGLDLVSRNGSIDDLAVRGGPEIKGNDIANLDAFRNLGPFGDSRPSLPTRPHIGLPDWRGDGPFSWWPRHASGPHHRVDNCGPDGGRHDNWQVRNLRDQLRSFQWLAHNGPWGMRVHARHEMHRIQDRLRELTA